MGGGGIRVIGTVGGGGAAMALAGGLDAFGGAIGGGGSGGFAGSPIGFGAGGGRGGRGGGGGGGGGAWAASEFGPAQLTGIAGLEKDSGGGEGGVGAGSPKIKFKEGETSAPIVYTGVASVSGELDKETVRRYIQTKMDQIRWCYQQEVQKNPDLAGQIVLQWTIAPTGKVVGVSVSSSTMNNQSVEQCIVSRVGTWVFPSPKGGGAVKVTYPFIFRVTKGR